jgi:hypothetical protein
VDLFESQRDHSGLIIYVTLFITSIIVTPKGITEKDSNNSLIGTRESILLVHPSIVVEIAKLLRSFIIEMAKHTRSNNGRNSKQVKLYDRLMSPEYARIINLRREKKSELNKLQRKEEEYHKKTWNSRIKLIEEWFKVDECNQHMIDEIIEDQTNEQS